MMMASAHTYVSNCSFLAIFFLVQQDKGSVILKHSLSYTPFCS